MVPVIALEFVAEMAHDSSLNSAGAVVVFARRACQLDAAVAVVSEAVHV
jgi:hypothetical protein